MATHRELRRNRVLSTFRRSHSSCELDEGQTMAEYAVVLCVLMVVCIAAFPALHGAIVDLLAGAADVVRNA